MSRSLGVAAAVAVAASAVVASPLAAPGPKQPVEHLGISGTHFSVRYGNPGCYASGGQSGAGFAVPREALVTGATVYVADYNPTSGVTAELTRHDFVSGGTYSLGKGTSTGTGDTKVEIAVPAGYVLAEGEAVNLFVTTSSSTCLKGAEVHFIRTPTPPAAGDRDRAPAPAPDLAPDAAADR